MKRVIALFVTAVMMAGSIPAFAAEKDYVKGSFVQSYNELDKNSRAWRDGMVSGNGEVGYVTSGSPYSDSFIFQHMYFNYPSSQPRYIPSELTGQLEDARLNVFNMNDKWNITDASGGVRHRTFYYSFHPGHQLRLKSDYSDAYTNYSRYTNYETAETGVKYTDKYGDWQRVSFTSRSDDVSIAKITQSSTGQLINMNISIDNILDMCKSGNGLSKVDEQRYKKIVPQDCSYIAQVAHYPAYDGSELYDGGYGGVTRIIVEGANAKATRVVSGGGDWILIGDNASVKIENATAVYLITASGRTFNMTGKTTAVMDAFSTMESYELIDTLAQKTLDVQNKHTINNRFNYAAALQPSAAIQKEMFNRVSFDLEGDESLAASDNNAVISAQRADSGRINHEFMRRAYEGARYAQICCSGTSAPRLYAMWTGEWNPGWRGIYTLDANVNLQVSAMNTGDLQEAALGYITFFLRHSPDFMQNAAMAYGMHDAIQVSVNADADRAMHVEYDNAYPFEYWNAGGSWCLLPIFEFWQCHGNMQIPINDYMRIDDLKGILSVRDGGLTDNEFAALKARGYLDLEQDILLPLLTKQANFWEQIVTPRYYTDINGNACHDESKTALNAGEKYIIIPAYSPENGPIGYNSIITANATMDISAARDGLDMICEMENALKRPGYEAEVAKWTALKGDISDYKTDSDGALREWAMSEYIENNNHRHLSHLYVAWPAYETQNDAALAKAANIALNNRNKYNTGDATAGHGWMHKALVEARLKRGDGMMKSLLMMMSAQAYYSSMMTDHDTNRRNDTYCTDTAFGTLGAVNEALMFSQSGNIEIIPALPKDWTKGSVNGLMARCRTKASEISWDIKAKRASVKLLPSEDNTIRVACGEAWTAATMDGKALPIQSAETGNYVTVSLKADEEKEVVFTLSDATNGTYTIESEGKYLCTQGIENGSAVIGGTIGESAYWNVANTAEGKFTIQSCATGKYLTREEGALVQRNYTGADNQLWQGGELNMIRQDFLRDVTITPDSIAITVNGSETADIDMAVGESVTLGVVVKPEGAASAITWKSDSIGNGVVTQNGTLTAYNKGVFNVTATAAEGYSVTLGVNVTGNARSINKATVASISAADDGYNGAWVPQNAFDGIAAKAYASKDDASVKYLEAELSEPTAVTAAYITGRYTASDGDGKYANRINGAKIYAANSPMRGSAANGVLVGTVAGVSATSAYIPAAVAINTNGAAYKYYMIYFDSVNNGTNISLAIADAAFYTGGVDVSEKASPIVTATEGTNAAYAADGNASTVFTIANQSAQSAPNQYLLFEFAEIKTIKKIIFKHQLIDNSYWADHALAVGCEFQGSLDGETWETISVMNTWPDGTDRASETVIDIAQPKGYKYVRYIRTAVKKSGDYAYWKWSSSDGGNRINVADVELYTLVENVSTRITNVSPTSLTLYAESNQDDEYMVFAAAYSADGRVLLDAACKMVELLKFEPSEVTLDLNTSEKTLVFIWDKKLVPVSVKTTI